MNTQRNNGHKVQRDRWIGVWKSIGGLAVSVMPAILVGFAPGCNDKPDSSPPPPTSVPASAMPAATRPTTQELVSGERQTVRLSPVLTLEVPRSWKTSSTDNASFIEGPTPHGQVRLQMSSSGTVLMEGTLNAMEKKAKADAIANPDKVTVAALRTIGGGAKVMERREAINVPIIRDDGTTSTGAMMDWLVEVFLPADKQFTLELVHFNNMPIGLYLEDKQFLEGIIRSLRYDGAGGALK